MPTRIGHQPPRNAWGALGQERWSQELPSDPGLYWYTEFEGRGREGPVWLCKIYRYSGKLWVRFFSGPYRIRLKGSRKKGGIRTVMYEKTQLDKMPYANGNTKFWLRIGSAPKPPVSTPWGRQQVGGLPGKRGKITKPRPKSQTVPRRV